MNGKTHLVLGIASGLATAHALGVPLAVGATLGAIGGLLPDIDHPQSLITSFIPFGWVAAKFIGGHRGLTHSLITLIIGTLAARQAVSDEYLLVFAGAYLTHLVADMATPDGVPLLLPLPIRFKLLPGGILRYTGWIIEAGAIVAGVLAIGAILALYLR